MPRIASKATKGKGKRWDKGHSSVSNPQSKKHRDKATQALSGNVPNQVVGSNKFKLTKDLLEKFDAIQLQKNRLPSAESVGNLSQGGVSDWLNNNQSSTSPEDDGNVRLPSQRLMNEDVISLGNVSAASIWTNCTNVSFDRFLNGFDAKSKIHKSMLTVLATVREAIGKENGTETETEYFAGLMITLNCVDTEEKLTSTLALIQMILKRVPKEVLNLKFNQTANALMKILNDRVNSQSPNGYLIKSIIGGLSILLQNQDRPAWELMPTHKVFQTLLSLVLHIKPRIRKAATFSVISIVGHLAGDVDPNSGIIVARKLLAEFCISKLEEHLITTQDEHLHILLYILSLLSDTLFQFPSVQLTKKACEAILSHMTLGNVLVVNGALQTFYSFFLRRPKSSTLSAELNAQLMNALYDYQPNMNDDQPLNAWCIALKEGLLSLHHLDPQLSQLHLLKFIKTTLACLQSDSRQVHSCVCNAIKAVFISMVQENAAEGNQSSIVVNSDLLPKLYSELESSLKYQFSHVWSQVIPMLSELFIDNEKALKSLGSIMQRLAILHESTDSDINEAIDGFFGKAVAFYGPQAILKQVPITWRSAETALSAAKQEGEFRGEFTNPWLLIILRDHTQEKAQLALFIDHFLPLADEISKKSTACKKLADKFRVLLANQMDTDNETHESYFRAHESCLVANRELKRCVHALWALLPAFCRNPVDVPQTFPRLAKRLGETLYDRELFTYPLAALRNLIKCSEAVTNSVAPFAKNYLPILFNLYTNENENTQIDQGMRLPVLILIQLFVPHLFLNEESSKTFYKLFENINKLLKKKDPSDSKDTNDLKECSDFTKKALHDILGAMLSSPKGFTQADIEFLFAKVAKPLIEENKSPTDQKTGFKIIEQMVSSTSPECIQFIRGNLEQHVNFLFSLMAKKSNFTAPSTRAFALRSIQRLVEQYLGDEKAPPIDWMAFFEQFLPCVLDCLLVKSVKAIKSAEKMLFTMASSYTQLQWTSGQHANESINYRLIKQIIGPLQNGQLSVGEQTARLMAINFLYLNKYIDAPKDLLCDIADVILTQISPSTQTAPTRKILDICFDFMINFFRKASPDMLNSYLEMITCNITNLPPEHRTKYRMKIRTLLVKLIRKFGYEFISSMISEDYQKVLKNIKKFEERKKRKKDGEQSDDDEDRDSESGIESDRKSRRSRKARSKFGASSDEDEDEVEKFIDDEWANKMDDDGEGDEPQFRKQPNLDIMSRLSTKSTKTYIREDVEGDPLDLLSPHAKKNVFSKIPRKYTQTEEEAADGEAATSKKLPISNDGRIMINELLDQIEAKDGVKSAARQAQKRNRNEVSEDESDDDSDAAKSTRSAGKSTYKPGGRGIHRAVSVSGESVGARSVRTAKSKASQKSSKSRRNEPTINRGDAYKSKCAAGDMKRRNMPDPYAYIPLNPIALNKRKAQKYKGEFNAIVKGAKKGAAAGARALKRAKSSK